MKIMKKIFKNKKLRTAIIVLLSIALAGIITVLSLNAYVVNYGKKFMLTADEAGQLSDVDCIIILGCYVKENNKPSDMLQDRLNVGINLYYAGCSGKLLMSGDHGRDDYNEVGTMKAVAMEAGIPSSAVFMDHAGFSTYETMYRAREVFGVKKAIIVTQEYHLYRSLFIANELGIEAYGVSADVRTYYGLFKRELREILARNKDVFYLVLDKQPTYLGDMIPIDGDGNLTND